MPARPILQLGMPSLFEPSSPVKAGELPALTAAVRDLHETMDLFQAAHGWGRAIAAPQIGIARRIVAMRVDSPRTLFNPVLDRFDPELREYWEDCMSFPDLLVRVRMPASCRLTYRDESWRLRRAQLTGDYAALLQHEVDHLDGVLATQRATGGQSLALRSTQPPKDLAWRGEFRFLDEPEASAG